MSQPVLIAKNLTKIYGQNVIFNDISLTVAERETIIIVGPSGTGKSTLLRCLNLLTRAEEGQVWLDGEEITAKGYSEDRARQHIGMVFQNFLLFNHLTALNNVMLGLAQVKKLPKGAGARAGFARTGPGGPGGPRRALPRAAFRRAAAAGGDRPGAGDATHGSCFLTNRLRLSTLS